MRSGGQGKRSKDRLINLFAVGCGIYSLLMICIHVKLEQTGGSIDEGFFHSPGSLALDGKHVVGVDQASTSQQTAHDRSDHLLAGLSCSRHGGPSDDVAAEMIYWEDIPTDAKFISPFHTPNQTKYITFELENSGFNNNRMNLENVLVMAAAMGRTLVLPAAEELCHLSSRSGHDGSKQESAFSFEDVYHLNSIAREHDGVKIISMEEFLTKEAVTGNLKDKNGRVMHPPHGRTQWDHAGYDTIQYELKPYLRTVGHNPGWDSTVCEVAFPKSTSSEDMEDLKDLVRVILSDGGFLSHEAFIGRPVPVDAPAKDRLREGAAGRVKLCFYDEINPSRGSRAWK
jgi:hypothetical protein